MIEIFNKKPDIWELILPIIGLIIAIIFICLSSCSYNSSYIEEDTEYIVIYDKKWKTKYYGKIIKE